MHIIEQMKLRSWLRGMSVVLLMGATCVAQVGPPACPVATGQTGAAVPAAGRAEAARTRSEENAADPSVMIAAEPIENFGVARFRLEDYGNCVGSGGCYWADLEAQTHRAEMALARVIATKKSGERLAMVMDIDETSLTNYCEMRREDFGFISSMYNAWEVSAGADMPIQGSLRLFRQARMGGIEVFFITGRPDDQRAGTIKNLEAAGYTGWKGLSLRVGPQQHMATIAYKSEERKKIVDAGYRIVMSVGDQWSDLNGEPRAEISVKLPNPFYFLP